MRKLFAILNAVTVIGTVKALFKLAVYARDAEKLKTISDLNLSLADSQNGVADLKHEAANLKLENRKLQNELAKMRRSKRRKDPLDRRRRKEAILKRERRRQQNEKPRGARKRNRML
jgi:biopolymer transport protein ExbB/TolQ